MQPCVSLSAPLLRLYTQTDDEGDVFFNFIHVACLRDGVVCKCPPHTRAAVIDCFYDIICSNILALFLLEVLCDAGDGI